MRIYNAPWAVESDGRGPYVIECGPDGPGRVCTIECESFKVNGGPRDWARAHLIKAAPDMLDVLVRVVAGFDAGLVTLKPEITGIVADARRAIGRATRKPQEDK